MLPTFLYDEESEIDKVWLAGAMSCAQEVRPICDVRPRMRSSTARANVGRQIIKYGHVD